MQAANIRELDDCAAIGRLRRCRVGIIHVQQQVCTPTMAVVEVPGEHAPRVAFVQDDDVIQPVSPDAADQAFDVRILSRAESGGENLFDAHALDASPKGLAIDRIAIPDQVLRRAIAGESLDDLLSRPLRGRIFRDIEVKDPAPLMISMAKSRRPPVAALFILHLKDSGFPTS